jgi:organic hydroperoxide reductase OsmC/OhrA
MSEHRAVVEWQRVGEFRPEIYPRNHSVKFEHGLEFHASAAPENIPASARGAPGIDPEQAFVASLSSCHMLWFLYLASQKKWVVDRYLDEAVGVLDKTWVSKVTLRPVVSFSGRAPTREEHEALHERAHEKCFIANSVKTEVRIEPRIA